MTDKGKSVFLSTALKTILRNTADYVFVKDTGLVYHAASEAFAAMAGYPSAGAPSAEAMAGKTDYDFFARELAEKYREDDRKVLESGEPILGMVEPIPDRDGKKRYTKTWKFLIRDETGALAGLYGVSRDVTRTVELEAEAENAQEYIKLIDNIPGGVGIFHRENGRFSLDFANDGYYRTHHGSREYWRKFAGTGVMSGICEEDRHILEEEYARVRESENTPGDAAYRIRGEDGGLYWIDMQFQYAYSRDGVPYYYASFSDLDRQKEAEEKLAESQKALREAIANSDIQFFTYFPGRRRGEIFTRSRRLTELPLVWENFPEDFLAYTQASPEDARIYREMIRRIDEGADEAECTVRFAYHGTFSWERLHITAIRGRDGRTVRAQGYSIDITREKEAEIRLQQERMHLQSLAGDVVEAFSFNITRNTPLGITSAAPIRYTEPVSEELVEDAARVAPPIGDASARTRTILLSVAGQIPDRKERELFLSTCSGQGIRQACAEGRVSAAIRYRRYVGSALLWVSTSVEILPDPESGDQIAFFYTRDINETVIREKINERIIDRNYETVSYCDRQTGRLFIKSTASSADAQYNGFPYADAVEAALEQTVAEKDREELRGKFGLDVILAELEKAPVYTIYFTQSVQTDGPAARRSRRMKNDIFYLDGNRDVIVFLLTDVTAILEEGRAAQEKLEAALLAAEQASVAKTEFLSRMSHEIRTPMNAIIGLDAIALQEKDLSAAMEDHLQKIGISARFLLSLINDILDMSRIESGRMMLKNEPFPFEEFISGINTILYEQCRSSGIDYDCVLKSYTEETYVGDATKLQQVLVNILGNAVKFTPRGGKIHFMIQQLSRTKERASLRFEISDTGIGIDEAFLPHLFEAFTQENRGRTSAYGGTGLGLAIARNIVNLMGGDITVHSIKNVGSEFTVDVELGLSQESIRRRRILDAEKLTPLYTLVVDDDVIVCQHTQLVLTEAGLKAEWVDSGYGAVERVTERRRERNDYDLILLDWKMPDMDGIETAREIRKVVGPEVTIIVMTAYDWTDIEQKAKAAGVDMFMKKPVFASSVTRAFENVFLHKQTEQEPAPQPDFDFRGRHILLAEDNEINAEIARSILELKGCAVDVAPNGVEAIETFTTSPVGHYDAILMDVRMPIMDGLEAAKTIRAMKKADGKTVPIIAMTANAFQEDVDMSLKAGMNAHLAKPIEPGVLYLTLERFFSE